ncbi:MAG: hypothetical protein ACOC6P_04450, partial [Candidatus Aminicenantaceae bacterium]
MNLGGGTASLSPFQRSLRSLPPLLGLRPATKGTYPFGIPQTALLETKLSDSLLRSLCQCPQRPAPCLRRGRLL